jgi:hypothetical protein
VQATNTCPRFEVTADGHGICSHAGVVLLAELADRLGLTSELGRRANRGLARPGGRHAHDRGAVLRDLVVMLADGGDALSDLASLRDQAGLFGRVCSTATAWRIVHEIAADPRGWRRVVSDGAGPRAGVGGGCGACGTAAHRSRRDPAGRPCPKAGRGGHVQARLRVPPAAGLAGPWRWDRGGAGGDLAAGQRRLQHRPRPHRRAGDGPAGAAQAGQGQPILVRADTAGATHAFVNDIVGRKLWFSIGFPLEPDVQAAILQIPAPTSGDDGGWVPALDPMVVGALAGGSPSFRPLTLSARAGQRGPGRSAAASGPPRRGAQDRLHRPHRPPLPGLGHQPARPRSRHPGCPPPRAAPGTTSRASQQPTAALESGHRAHARVEDRIRCAKATGLRNLPFADFDANDAWLTLVLVAQTLVCWAQALLLDGELARAEPKTLRYRLWHAAARLVRHARRHVLRFDHDWPWATALVAAFKRLPVPG